MVSLIDPTKPADGAAASKADMRSNFATAKSEVEALQAKTQYLNTYSFQGRRNALHNSAFLVNQQSALGAALVNNTFVIDRWKGFSTQANALNVGGGPSANMASSGYYIEGLLSFTGLTGITVASGDKYSVRQVFERLPVIGFYNGPMTLSFLAFTNQPGTYGFAIQMGGRSYTGTFTVGVANTVTPIAVSIPPDTGMSLAPGLNPQIEFDLGSGTGQETASPGVWSNTYRLRTAACNRIAGVTGATFLVSRIQLERGDSATPYEMQFSGDALRDCQRYYEIVPFSLAGYASAGSQFLTSPQVFKATKQAAPTMIQLVAGTPTNATGPTVNSSTTEGVSIGITSVAAGIAQINGASYAADAQI